MTDTEQFILTDGGILVPKPPPPEPEPEPESEPDRTPKSMTVSWDYRTTIPLPLWIMK